MEHPAADRTLQHRSLSPFHPLSYFYPLPPSPPLYLRCQLLALVYVVRAEVSSGKEFAAYEKKRRKKRGEKKKKKKKSSESLLMSTQQFTVSLVCLDFLLLFKPKEEEEEEGKKKKRKKKKRKKKKSKHARTKEEKGTGVYVSASAFSRLAAATLKGLPL